MTKLQVTKTDPAGRHYFLCQCECGRQYELRVDHIKAKVCKHGKRSRPIKNAVPVKRSVKVYIKEKYLINPRERELVITGAIKQTIKKLKKIYIVREK